MNKTMKRIVIVLLIFAAVNVGNAFRAFDIVTTLVKLAVTTTFTSTYDTNTPLGSDDPAEADDRMREIKLSNQQRNNVDHFWPLTGTEVSDADTGEHRKVLFHEPISSPGTVAVDHGQLFIKDVAAKAELHWIDEDEQEVQLTSGGDLISSTNLGVTGNAVIGGYLDIGSTVQIVGTLDDDTMGTATGTTLATSESIKAYIDNSIAFSAMTAEDADTDAIARSVTYTATSDGFLSVKATLSTGNNLSISVNGVQVANQNADGNVSDQSVFAIIASGETFIVGLSPGSTNQIFRWRSRGALSKPTK